MEADKRRIVEAWVRGTLTETEAARQYGVTRQNFPRVVGKILRHMVQTDRTDFIKALKHYWLWTNGKGIHDGTRRSLRKSIGKAYWLP